MSDIVSQPRWSVKGLICRAATVSKRLSALRQYAGVTMIDLYGVASSTLFL